MPEQGRFNFYHDYARHLDEMEILSFIIAYHNEEGVAPTLREMCNEVHRSRGYVCERLAVLAAKGFIRRAPGVHRGIQVLKYPVVEKRTEVPYPSEGKEASSDIDFA